MFMQRVHRKNFTICSLKKLEESLVPGWTIVEQAKALSFCPWQCQKAAKLKLSLREDYNDFTHSFKTSWTNSLGLGSLS